MTPSDVEARLRRLEHSTRKLLDIREIQNVMGRRASFHSAVRHDLEFSECWSREREDISLELEEWGVWDGREAVYDCYVRFGPPPGGAPGVMVEHCLTTDVIEVADDGETAKGVWFSPGHETYPVGGEEPVAQWCWNRYGVDFVKEGGAWKIWHLHVYSVFRVPYGTDWVTGAIDPPATMLAPEELPSPDIPRPSRPKTFNQIYTPGAPPTTEPRAPVPYATFADTWSYTDPPPPDAGGWTPA